MNDLEDDTINELNAEVRRQRAALGCAIDGHLAVSSATLPYTLREVALMLRTYEALKRRQPRYSADPEQEALLVKLQMGQMERDAELAREAARRQPGCPVKDCAACRDNKERADAIERLIARAGG